MTRILSVVIPFHGQRTPWVKRNLENLASDPRIYEFVIVDDCSSPEDYQALLDLVHEWKPRVQFPIWTFRNAQNLFVFRNKIKAVEQAGGPWVALIDSDNVIDSSYIDAWHGSPVVGPACPHMVAMPEFARPEFDYRAFSARGFTKHTIAKWIDRPGVDCCLNTMNFIVSRHTFLMAVSQCADGYEPKTADSIWINTLLLQSGACLYVTPEMQYEHTVHADSTWRLHHHGDGDRENDRIVALLKEMR